MPHISIHAHSYKALAFAALSAVFTVLMVLASAGQASAYSRPGAADAAEQSHVSQYLSSLNGTRASNGLGALSLNGTFSAGAQSHAESMGAQNRLSHADDVFTRCSDVGSWNYCAENVGTNTLGADSVSRAASLFLSSSGHRANILNPNFDTVGIGVEHANGSFWIVVRFMDRTDTASPAPTTKAKAPSPSTTAAISESDQAAAAAPSTPVVKKAPSWWLAAKSIMFDSRNKCRYCLETLEFVDVN